MSLAPSLPPFIQLMLNPATHRGEKATTLIQTHISYVVVAGDLVYKFKKPVDFGFLNFATLDRRHSLCKQELILNRRLCPEIYLGLVSINQKDGHLSLCDPADQQLGTVIEYGVKMARMPEERMMVNIIRASGLTQEMLDQIVAVLAPFYQRAETGERIKAFGTVQAVGRNVLENLGQCQEFVGCESLNQREYDTIGSYINHFLTNKALFNQRITMGRIRDCHGDLHSANICITDRVLIYDCIEFNHRLRYSDVACDVAFLAMDLDYHGLTDLADAFIERFKATTDDHDLSKMLQFYKCYRATVRGKIGLLTAHEPEVDGPTRTQALTQATRYFALAQKYAQTK